MKKRQKKMKAVIGATTFLWISIMVASFATPGIDPRHPQLNEAKKNQLYRECKSNSGTEEKCEQAMLYELHLKDNVHKGVSTSLFYLEIIGDEWVDALKVASKESGYFGDISNDTDSSLFNSIQANINASSMGYEMTTRFNRLAQNIDAYSSLMDTNLRGTLLDHKIEAAITQLLFNLKMEEEIKEFGEIVTKNDIKKGKK